LGLLKSEKRKVINKFFGIRGREGLRGGKKLVLMGGGGHYTEKRVGKGKKYSQQVSRGS